MTSLSQPRLIDASRPFVAFCSQAFGPSSYSSAKYHSTPQCKPLLGRSGAERTDRKLFEHVFEDAHEMFRFALRAETRPCRMCLLEPALLSVLASDPDQPESFVTFSSQPSPDDPSESLLGYKWSTVTESGEARLTRVARALGLQTTQTSTVGLVAYGFVPELGAEELAWNLRAFSFDGVEKLPSPITVETFWTLESDSPRQLGKATFEPFEVAILLEG